MRLHRGSLHVDHVLGRSATSFLVLHGHWTGFAMATAWIKIKIPPKKDDKNHPKLPTSLASCLAKEVISRKLEFCGVLMRFTPLMRHPCFGFFPIRDMQSTSPLLSIPPPPLQFCSDFNESCAMCWIEWKINFLIFIFGVIVDFVHNFQVFNNHKILKKKIYNVVEFTWKMRNKLKRMKNQFPIFNFWVMINFVLKNYWILCTKTTISQNRKINFWIRFNTFRIFHLNTFEILKKNSFMNLFIWLKKRKSHKKKTQD